MSGALSNIKSGSAARAADVLAALGQKVSTQNGKIENTTTIVDQSGTQTVTLGERVSLSAFKLSTDADWSPAFQRAHDYLASTIGNGGIVELPAEQLAVGSVTVTITAQVIFRGQGYDEGYQPGTQNTDAVQPGRGTWLVITNTTNKPFVISGQRGRGGAFEGMGVWQQHAAPSTASWAPTVYPFVWTVTGTLGEWVFRDIMFMGVYNGISLSGCGRVRMNHINGQVFNRGFLVDAVEDCCMWHDIHFQPLWGFSTAVATWSQVNFVGAELQRVDTPIFSGTFWVYGALAAIKMSSSSNGICTGLQMDMLNADASKYGLWVTGSPCSAMIGMLSTGGEAGTGGGFIDGSSGIQIEGSGTFQIGIAQIWDCGGSAIVLSSQTVSSVLYISNLFAIDWDQANSGAVAIFVSNCNGPHTVISSMQPYDIRGNSEALFSTTSNGIIRIPGYDYFISNVSGNNASYAFANSVKNVLVQCPTTSGISGFAVTLPTNPLDGDEFTISASAPITGITYTSPISIINEINSIAAGQRIRVKYLGTGTQGWWMSN